MSEKTDTKMLLDAVKHFHQEQNETNFLTVLQVLRDCFVWVPCTAVESDRDREAMQRLLEEAEDDPESLVGAEITRQDDLRMVPQLVQSGDRVLFPVFTSTEAMGSMAEDFSQLEAHILEVVRIAKNTEEAEGIVLDAFTDPLVIDRQLYELLEALESREEE